MPTAFVLGSCVTRDCFEVPDRKSLTCSNYFARSSLISVMAPPCILERRDFFADNNFAHKAICRDFDKELLAAIESADYDLFVIDYVDERFPVLEYRGSYVTRSHELERSGILSPKEMAAAVVSRFSARSDRLWQQACRSFVRSLRRALRGRPVVLHRALWAKTYQMSEHRLVPFDCSWTTKIASNNNLLNRCYDFMKSEMPEIIDIVVPEEKIIADGEHKWGLHAIHYLPDYYASLYRSLEGIAAARCGPQMQPNERVKLSQK